MTPRPRPTRVAHFTHVNHLASIIRFGILADRAAQDERLLTSEVGNLEIKGHRRRREVPLEPGGRVGDYVPFYFAPRSPMMYVIHKGNVPTYQEGTSKLIYLVSSLERLRELDHDVLISDRNAVLRYAEFRRFEPLDKLDDGHIDWELMRARDWANTPDDPDRRERRMAEALVHGRVRWEAVTKIVVRSNDIADEVELGLTEAEASLPVDVRPDWYF